MPVEIRELVIKVRVEEPAAASAAGSPGAASRDEDHFRRDLLRACREMIEDRLQKLRER